MFGGSKTDGRGNARDSNPPTSRANEGRGTGNYKGTRGSGKGANRRPGSRTGHGSNDGRRIDFGWVSYGNLLYELYRW